MKEQDKIFVAAFAIVTIFIVVIVASNFTPRVRTVHKPDIAITKETAMPAKIESLSKKVKEKIKQAGIKPHEAKYWKVIEVK